MSQRIVLKPINNPGISFTKETNNKLLGLNEILNNDKDKVMSYAQFQELLINEGIFSGSYIRSFIPFLFNLGMINEYSTISFNSFFTDLGEAYVSSLKLIEDSNENEDAIQMKQNILLFSLEYMKYSECKYYSNYIDILKFVKKFNTINREEFFINEYCIQNNISSDQMIDEYRKNNTNYDIYILNGDGEEMTYRNNNSFNYFIAYLGDDQTKLVCKQDQNNYVINNNKLEIINELIKDKGVE